ncbi:MAG: hypothetical protein K2K60_05350 [Clostridia bacterium]|nr:hypothetical protein [Clostridia bacterium]
MKTQMRFQKYLVLAVLIVAALSFVYALSFCGSTIYQYGTLYDSLNDKEYVDGAKALFEASQKYNDVLLWLSIVFILVVVLNFVMASNKRRNYYVTNYISVILTAVSAIAFAAVLIWIVIDTYSLFVTIDVEAAEFELELTSIELKYSTINFIMGYIVAAISVISAGLMIFNLVWKVKLMQGEKKLLAASPVQSEQVTAEEGV